MRLIFLLLLSLSVFKINAQSTMDEVLLKVDNEPVYVSEFLTVYNKNLDIVQDESQKEVDKYLDLFVNYKLKLKEAKSLGLHEKQPYINEFTKYRKQLAENYIKDTEVKDTLVKEAYQRLLYEVNANHILVKVDVNATPQDTLKAYNEILNFRKATLKEGFENVMKTAHNGNTVFGEKLGYFSGFKMVYDFENVAYNTKVGAISKPFKTRFGYHIVNVLDKRKSRGKVKVAHIMLVENKKDSLAQKPDVKIQELYKKLNQGEGFEDLAKQFSDDKNSAPKGGLLKPFSGGELRAKTFEDIAFGLETIGAISKPFKTDFGWHIVKLYEKIPLPSFEASQAEIIQKIKRGSRSKLMDDALIKKLKTKYKVPNAQPQLDYFETILNDDYFKNAWLLPENFQGEKPLIKIEDKQLTYADFGDYLEDSQSRSRKKEDLSELVSKLYNSFFNKRLIQYQEDNLENENKEFAQIVSEYRDGLLLFDLMESAIWNTSDVDSTQIKQYYETHKHKYISPARVDAVVGSSSKKKTLKKVSEMLANGKDVKDIKSLVNTKNKVDVVFTIDTMDADHQSLPKDFIFKKGVSNIVKHNGSYVVVLVKDVLAETPKSFEEAKGQVIVDYQDQKEKNWLNDLKSKYKVVINEDVLKRVKSKIKKK